MRRQPVAFALVDAAFLADTKFRKLRRRLSEPRDFNSAVGAWLIVLTAARRNGLPDVDAADEAEDDTFLPDLIAVGLLTPTGIPDKPYRAWAPSRPKFPSDANAPDAPSATDAPTGSLPREYSLEAAPSAPVVPFPPPDSPSTPFPSPLIPSLKEAGGSGGEEEDDGRVDLEAFLLVTRRAPSLRQRALMDGIVQTHDITGPVWAADIILAHPDDPIGALITADKLWRSERITAAQAAEKPKPKRRRIAGLPESARELVELWAEQEKERLAKATAAS